MFVLTFVLSYDFMATFITIYFFWQWVSISSWPRSYGLVFALYALGSSIGSPLLSILLTKTKSIKVSAILCLAIDLVGNLLYAFAAIPANSVFPFSSLHDGTSSLPSSCSGDCLLAVAMVCVGRFLAGVGGSGILISLLYLTLASSTEHRILAMNRYRSWGFWGRLAGPLVGTVALYLPHYNIPLGNDYSMVLNGMTYPPLATAIFCVLALPLCAFAPDLPVQGQDENEPEAKETIKNVLLISAVSVAATICFWIMFSQIMVIGVFMFQIVTDISDAEQLWLIYLPPIIGAVVSMIAIKRFIQPDPESSPIIDEQTLLYLSGVGLALSMGSLLQFKTVENKWVYYIGGSLIFFFNGIFTTAFRTVYSKVCGQSPHLSFFLSWMNILTTIGGVIGPAVSGLIITVDNDGVVSGLNIAVPIAVAILASSLVFLFLAIRSTRSLRYALLKGSSNNTESMSLNRDS
eukprot:TRINITY_DN4096_c0_g1_i3.p1 TRINITY_DN4096_c0_g1~~TRINITY_DN4096_c0_g1_i3.p1  ORF type:complete len:495 (-),score=32.92 TRINITY_DN4096_c0_g1_i3:123-1508(-)